MNKNPIPPTKLNYRAEIDGLRAIAVVSVIFYHAQIVDWFKGGFIGVDIFFVISGYLITRIILIELYAKNSFSFINFYERRARRILPVLFLVIFSSIPFAWQTLLPTAFVEYAESILASLFFGSNFFFYFSTTEYGAESALLKPFLHTWSLGVEEQFYLAFPIIALAAFKYCKNHFLIILTALSLLSLQFSDLMEIKNSNLNFYLPFSRFWELSIGSVLAYRELNTKDTQGNFWTQLFPVVGLFLVLYSILSFNGETPHPSFHTVLPVLGVAMIIGYASKHDLIGKILGSRPFVWVGLLSYSAYLWHFPIFAFSRNIHIEPSNYDKFFWIFLTVVLSIISYFFVEQPLRNRKLVSSKKLLIVLIPSLSLLILVMTLIITNNGYENRFQKIKGFANYQIDNQKLRNESWTVSDERTKTRPNFDNAPNNILVIGNSHSKDMFNALYLNRDSFSGFDFLMNIIQISCFNENIVDYAPVRQKFYDSNIYKAATTIVVSTRYRSKKKCNDKIKDHPISADLDALPYLITRAKSDGKKVMVMGNTPEFLKIEKKWVADYIHSQFKNSTEHSYRQAFNKIKLKADRLLYKQLNNKVLERIEKAKKITSENNAIFFDKIPLICNQVEKKCDAYTPQGFKTFYDYGHFTLEGAKFFGERLAKDPSFIKDLSR